MLTAVPVRGRFERVVITTSTFFDHNLTALIDTLAEKMVVSYAARRFLLAPLREHRMVLNGALCSFQPLSSKYRCRLKDRCFALLRLSYMTHVTSGGVHRPWTVAHCM